MPPRRLIQHHDQFFKRLLDTPGAADALLRERLPPEVVAQLSAAPAERVAGSFIDARHRAFHADRLYRMWLKGGTEALVYMLVEHKQTPRGRTGLQLLGYMTQIWQQWARNAPEGALLPPILPLVFHHGRQPWSESPAFAAQIVASDTLRPYVLDYRYALFDLGHSGDAPLLSQHRILRFGLLLLKHDRPRGGTPAQLREVLITIGRELLPDGPDVFIEFLRYVLNEDNPVDLHTLREVVSALVPGQEEHMVSVAAQQIQSLARQEGFLAGQTLGQISGKREALIRLLTRRFGLLSAGHQARIEAADAETLDHWFDAALDAASVDAVFATPHSTDT